MLGLAMSWITNIWSMSSAVSVTFAAIHLAIWVHDRKAWANFLFACTALSVSVFALFELAMMRADTAAQFAAEQRWGHVPLFAVLVSLIGFIVFYFRTGLLWLAWTVIALRLIALILNFLSPASLNFRAIVGLQKFHLLGETVSVPIGVPGAWARLGEGSAMLALIFVLDAAIRLWRRGNPDERRRAVVVGGSVSVGVLLATLNALLIHTGAVPMPYVVSLCLVFFTVAMGSELSRDIMHAAKLAEEVRENAESMALAARAARQALWRWDIDSDVIWANSDGLRLLGLPETNAINLARFLESIHADDQQYVRKAIACSMEGDGDCRAEYRAVLPNGASRWFTMQGQIEFNNTRQPVRMRGVSIDSTERKMMEVELARHRGELAHLTRVNTMSELSGSLAHELNQPLGIILSNAQAAQDLVAKMETESSELAEILSDIVAADRRAGEVIRRLRTLLKRGESVLLPLSVNQVIEEVVHLVQADLIVRGVTVVQDLARDLPPITGDQVQLQQVILNLILNAADAMAANAPGTRQLHLTTARHHGTVRVSVRDEGGGLPGDIERLFEPFYTTKVQGLGMGLAICRSIVAAHQGQLWAARHPDGGAVFHVELPNSWPQEPT